MGSNPGRQSFIVGMNQVLRLRPAQESILAYRGGRMAVSAVPGSGKTFTLSMLAAQLIAESRIDLENGQQVLIVTFLNSSVENFRARIRRRLLELGLPDTGFDVRTLHSLSLEIVRASGESLSEDIVVLDDSQRRQYLETAVDGWINDNNSLWEAFLPEDGRGYSPQMIARWRDITANTAEAFIRTAKNERYRPEDIYARIRKQLEASNGRDEEPNIARSPLLHMMTGIYHRYQSTLARQGGLDYDDLIWQAADRLEHRADLAHTLRNRWPFVLEDEAQDSVPLQELLLEQLTGPDGNWVRVGDPNQAITSTFTAAHPRYLSQFIARPDVIDRTLPNSGRSARVIIGAANAMLNWTIDQHPLSEVRENTFRRQDILPAPPGDGQPNPPDHEAEMRIRVYRNREEEELPAVAREAWEYAQQNPDWTVAILVPTHNMGYQIAEHLDAQDADYDNLLRGSGREREIAAALHAVLAVLADPMDNKALQNARSSLDDLTGGSYLAGNRSLASPAEDDGRLQALLRSIRQPEAVLYPLDESSLLESLPAGIATEEDLARLTSLGAFLRQGFELRSLPIDDLVLTLADLLFIPQPQAGHTDHAHELDLAIAYQIAGLLRQWREAQPDWRLPELVAQLRSVATGRRTINVIRATDTGYEPTPGRISLSTQHNAKGLEWDIVFLVGIDGMWIPGSLEAPFLGVHDFLGGDPTAEANAQLRYLMASKTGLYPNRTATESAHIEVISERLRLLYVGITRARRRLYISRSRTARQQNRERDTEPATVLGVLYRYLQEQT